MKILKFLPEAPPAHMLALVLNAGLCLGLLSRSALDPLAGKTVALEASDLGTRVCVAYDGNRFRAHAARVRIGPADLTIRSSSADFLSLALRREDPDTLFFTRRLIMTGDTELGLIVKNALDAIDWSRVPFLRRSTFHPDRM